jgi:L-fucose isomerase-like protein
MKISVFTLTSPLHDKQTIETYTKEFFSRLDFEFDYKGEDFSTYGKADLDIIFVRTGGTENLFKQRYMDVLDAKKSVYLLASYSSNSLAASMEILSWLKQRGIRGEILHGSHQYISSRISELVKLEAARKALKNTRAAVIGRPSDWLIASDVNREAVQEKLGFDIEYIPIEEVENICGNVGPKEDGAITIYNAIKSVVTKHQINAFSIRCFDLLSSLKNTGCLALAKLNSEGIVAGCEGDAPAMVSMIIARSLTGKSGFQANPARVNVEKGEVLFAHCTIPLNMVERYEFDTHFESGIGVGIRGFMKEGPVTVFKVSGDLTRFFAEEGELIENGKAPNLCRTQQLIRFTDKDATKYFLQNPIGNHHIILQGHWKNIIFELLK